MAITASIIVTANPMILAIVVVVVHEICLKDRPERTECIANDQPPL